MSEPANLERIKRKITDQTGAWYSSHVQSVTKYLEGDHWQNGNGWTGPRPTSQQSVQVAGSLIDEIMDEIKRVFVFENMILSCVSRHVEAVTVEPSINMQVARELGLNADDMLEKLTTDEQKLIKETNAAITAWMDSKKLLHHVMKAATQAIATGRGVIRLYVPAKSLIVNANGKLEVPRGTLEESMKRVYLSSPDASNAGVLLDANDDPQYAYLKFVDPDDDAKRERLEIQTLQNDNVLIEIENAEGDFDSSTYKLGGVLLTYELNRPLIVGSSIIAQQKLLNKHHTMLSRNVDVAGFVETTILNGQVPFVLEDDPNNPGQKIKRIVGMQSGAARKNFVAPGTVENEDGTYSNIPASIDHRQPVDVNNFLSSILSTKAAMREEFKQAHIALGNDSSASGVSREQARADFDASLEPTIAMLEGMYRWLFGTLVKLGAFFASGQTQKYDGLRPVVSVTPRKGIVTPEKLNMLVTAHEAGFITRENAMLQSQLVKDPAAEIIGLKAETREQRGIGDPNKLRDSIVNAIANNAISITQGLLEMGYSPDDAVRIGAEIALENAALQAGIPITQPAPQSGQ